MAPEGSLEALYDRYGYVVYRRCLFLLQSEADAWDAVQEVFLRARDGLATFEGRASHRTWLDTIATRHCLNVLRARRVRLGRGNVPPEALDLEDLYPEADPGAERALLVRHLLERFDPQVQEAALFYFVDEMSQEDVAARVGLSVPTLRKRLRTFVDSARKLLTRSEAATVPLPLAARRTP